MLSALKGNLATAPILVLVAHVSSGWETIEEALNPGAADSLAKPFDHDDLLSRVQRVLTATDHPRVGRGMVYAAPSQPTPNAGVQVDGIEHIRYLTIQPGMQWRWGL